VGLTYKTFVSFAKIKSELYSKRGGEYLKGPYIISC